MILKKQTKKKRVDFRPLMLLRVYRNRFLRNHTGMVVPRVFPSCWKPLAFDQIQLDAYCAAVWRRFEATFKLWPVIPIFKRNEITECPRKPRQSNLDRNHMAYATLLNAVGTQCLVVVFLPLVCFLSVFFHGDSQFYVDTLPWIGPCYNVRTLFCLNNVNWKRCRL